jgi:hypothetical protein
MEVLNRIQLRNNRRRTLTGAARTRQPCGQAEDVDDPGFSGVACHPAPPVVGRVIESWLGGANNRGDESMDFLQWLAVIVIFVGGLLFGTLLGIRAPNALNRSASTPLFFVAAAITIRGAFYVQDSASTLFNAVGWILVVGLLLTGLIFGLLTRRQEEASST